MGKCQEFETDHVPPSGGGVGKSIATEREVMNENREDLHESIFVHQIGDCTSKVEFSLAQSSVQEKPIYFFQNLRPNSVEPSTLALGQP